MAGIIRLGWVCLDGIIFVTILVVIVRALALRLVSSAITSGIATANVGILIVLGLLTLIVVLILWIVFSLVVIVFLSPVNKLFSFRDFLICSKKRTLFEAQSMEFHKEAHTC